MLISVQIAGFVPATARITIFVSNYRLCWRWIGTDHMFSAGRVRKGPAPVRPIKFSLLFSSTYSSPPVKLRDSSVRIQRGGGQACHRVNCNAYFCLRIIEKCALSPNERMCTVLLSHSLILRYSQRQNKRKQTRYSKHAIITSAFMREIMYKKTITGPTSGLDMLQSVQEEG